MGPDDIAHGLTAQGLAWLFGAVSILSGLVIGYLFRELRGSDKRNAELEATYRKEAVGAERHHGEEVARILKGQIDALDEIRNLLELGASAPSSGPEGRTAARRERKSGA